MSVKNLTVLEDNIEILSLYDSLLRPYFSITMLQSLADFRKYLSTVSETNCPDVFLSDLILSDGCILDMVEDSVVSSSFVNWPTIVVSVKDDIDLMRNCTKVWANEYLVKPFNNNALVHKCLSLSEIKQFIEIDPLKMIIRFGDLESEELSSKEFRIMSFLIKHDYSTDKNLLLQEIWGTAHSTNVLHTTLSRLRPKLTKIGFGIQIDDSGQVVLDKIQTQEI